MTMSENDIIRNFREAKKKREQIGILADMNQCSRDEIREILLSNGISEAELPAKPGRRPSTEETKIFLPAKSTKQEPGERASVADGTVTPAQESKEDTPTVKSETGIPAEAPKVDAVHVVTQETLHMIPETVKQLCRDRIWNIIQEIAGLEREKQELRMFLGENMV